ncbi:hypothetical protein PIB30_075729 [Stylosanthes scabra]|uniref:Flagellar FliJ protein n=1 Tax=Stylosanthes scabra TaxID=79078 RepID=A0ABU6QQH4_9FABA|nr:hypothetical protein [Stylosanthes scabra]
MKIKQEQFFENMQKAQSQYLDELKSLRTRQDEMVNQQNNFYRQIKREQEKAIKEIEKVKKFQVNQTLMGAQRTTEEKLEERMHETRNEIIQNEKVNQRLDKKCFIKRRSNVANKKDPYYGALKSDLQQGESSQFADQATQNPPNP